MPNVSVIMPSYNHEKYIPSAIESVLNQTYTDFELIIIDDASKDKSKEIIKAYKEKDSRIRAIFHNENKGIARTMNEAIEKASRKFLALFSSDDVWVKDKLKKQLEVLKKNENLVVWSEGLVINALGNPNGELFTQKHGALKRKKSGDIFEELLKGNYICGQSVIFKKENINSIKYDEKLKYLNDYKFMVNLARRYEFYFIPEPLIMYRIHGKNSILSDKKGWQKEEILINKYFLQKYNNEISNKTKNKIMLSLSRVYSDIGKKEKAKQYIFHAVKHNPFCLSNLIRLGIILTKKDGIVRNFIKWNYKNYKNIKKMFNF